LCRTKAEEKRGEGEKLLIEREKNREDSVEEERAIQRWSK
jgi:hypothetical protein